MESRWPDGDDGILQPDPILDAEGFSVHVRLRPSAASAGVSRIAVAHGEDATGWWIGLDEIGRVVAGVGTVRGPVSVSAGPVVAADEAVDVEAQFPGGPGDRLTVSVTTVRGTVSSTAVMGALPLAPRGAFRRGGRGLRDGRVLLPFDGGISELAVRSGKHSRNL